MTKTTYQTPAQSELDRIGTALDDMRHAILACHDPDGGAPLTARIACQRLPDGQIMALLAGISGHSRALASDPRAGLFITPTRGQSRNPMTASRLSLQCRATASSVPTPAQIEQWLAKDPQAAIYISLPDFRFWHLLPESGLWNAGFGRAFQLKPQHLQKSPVE